MPVPIEDKQKENKTAELSDKTQAEMRSRVISDIRSATRFATDDAHELWRWNGSRWELSPESWTWDTCSDQIGTWKMQGHLTQQFVATVHANLKTKQPRLVPKPPLGQINLLNGIFDIPSGKFTPRHDPSIWLSPVQIPVRFNSTAQCPAWDAFLAQILPPDAIHYAWEIIGSCLVSDTVAQAVFWFSGEGGNGKGTLFQALLGLVGMENVLSTSFQKLESDPFMAAQLYNKLVFMDPDSPLRALKQSEIIKTITAHDVLTTRHIYGRPFSYKPFSKVLVAANGLPTSSDISLGFQRRPKVIPMNAYLAGSGKERPQAQILAELAQENEGALRKAIDHLKPLLTRGFYSEPASVAEATASYRHGAHPMNEFMEEFLLREEDATCTLEAVLAAQVEWAGRDRAKILSANALRAWLERNVAGVSISRPKREGRRWWEIRGLRLLE